MEHPPVLGQKIKSYDDKATLQVRGVKQTLTIAPFKPPHHFQPLGGVAVIADNTWAAFRGRKALKVDWDASPNSVYNSDEFRKTLESTSRQPCKVVRNVGDVDAEFAKGGKIMEAEYSLRILPMLRWNRRWPLRNTAMEKFWRGRRRRHLKPCRRRLRAYWELRKRTLLATSRCWAEGLEENQNPIRWRKPRCSRNSWASR